MYVNLVLQSGPRGGFRPSHSRAEIISRQVSGHNTLTLYKVKVEVAQLCPTLCDPMDYMIYGMLRARILEWVALPFSRDLPNPGIEARSATGQAHSLSADHSLWVVSIPVRDWDTISCLV